MREYSLEVSPSFWRDLELALDYIAYELCNPIASKKLYRKVTTKINSLRFAPKMSNIKDDLYSAKVKGYRIIYKVIDDKSIIRLLHFWCSRRNIRKLLG